MPGIIGCFNKVGSREELEGGQKLLNNQVAQINDKVFEANSFRCTRVHLGVIGAKKSPVSKAETHCWVEGEIYNLKILREQFSLKKENIAGIILAAYNKDVLKEFLNRADGFFCCLIYDASLERLFFVADRLGLKPLYLWKENDALMAWSSEIKGLTAFEQFEKNISKENILDFLHCGQYLENTTPFKNINLLPPSSILCIDCKTRKLISIEKYWSWEQIQTINISYEEAVTRFGVLLKKAVHSRMESEDDLCISLSGGLDSRLILAAAIEIKPAIKTFTFGIRNSYEQRIAKKVAKTAKVENFLFPPTKDNWFDKRIEGIWKTDGMLNFIHMHGSVFHEAFRKINPICIHGIGGGILLGGRMLSDGPDSAIQKKYGKRSSKIDTSNPFFYLENKACQYLINNRLRRFTLQGILEQKHMENRMPFFQNDLIEFIFSIPDSYRKDAKLFNKTLLQIFPNLFDKIPYSNISYPISGKRKFISRLDRKIQYLLHKYKLSSAYHINDYPKWVAQKQAKIINVLNSKTSIFREYINESDFKIPDAENFLMLGRLFTVEIYLQQLFNDRFLTTEEFLASAE